ncbi:FAD binding domain-containing protein [Rhodococcus opacus]|uniref:Putative ketone dehydrogenase medium subunit n=1 Tax=Rhodococcus opacus (strain B4) TaxID=632772 RepID=C1B572_RHOOB|nr:xanthine dehydrogenase family protein subunit M [Rhodococcus opacus]BAH50998.1 putative ketone dehydrogenase medium subunit [Rhodococcus opacus B4]
MKPPPFDYEVAESIDDALTRLRDGGDDAKLIAGGQSLMPLMNYRLARPTLLIDINRIPRLADITVGTDRITFGALVRHHKLETSPTVAEQLPLLREAAGWIAHPQIRTRGTMGGSLAHSDASAELPVALMALDAEVLVRSLRGERTLTIPDLVVGHFVSSLAPDEMITEIHVPRLPAGTGMAFAEFARRHGDYAIGGAAAVLTLDEGGVCRRARITVLGGGATALRCHEAEALVTGEVVEDPIIAETALAAITGLTPMPNLHGDSNYRRQVIATMVSRTVTEAARRARSNS